MLTYIIGILITISIIGLVGYNKYCIKKSHDRYISERDTGYTTHSKLYNQLNDILDKPDEWCIRQKQSYKPLYIHVPSDLSLYISDDGRGIQYCYPESYEFDNWADTEGLIKKLKHIYQLHLEKKSKFLLNYINNDIKMTLLFKDFNISEVNEMDVLIWAHSEVAGYVYVSQCRKQIWFADEEDYIEFKLKWS